MAEASEAPKGVNTETGEIEQNRAFPLFLSEVRHGALVDELRDHLAEVVQAVRDTQKSGSVTLTLKVGLGPGGNSMVIADDVKTKVPEPSKDHSLFFADDKGDLRRTDPRQMQLGDGLREVPGD